MAKKISSFISDLIDIIVVGISIFLFVYLLILQPHKIDGSSMEPNFSDGEFLLTEKVSYRFGKPERGDVITFFEPNSEKTLIKRIIGLPGEKISIKNGKVFINSQQLEEKYLTKLTYTSGGVFLRENEEKVVPKDSYFVLGDNRIQSLDSRTLGFIDKKRITGKAWLAYWPPNKFGFIKRPSYQNLSASAGYCLIQFLQPFLSLFQRPFKNYCYFGFPSRTYQA